MRFGTIGTNWITESFIKAGNINPSFSLKAVYSRNKNKAKEFADKFRAEYIFTDINEMAESGTIDAVYIASPNSLHKGQTEIFLKNKVAVLCEKPAASNLNELKEIVSSARKHETLFMEAMKLTFMPNFNKIADFLPELGEIRQISASFCQYSSRMEKLLAGEKPNVFNPEFSGGSLMDIGIYPVYFIVSLFGLPENIQSSAIKVETGVDGHGNIILDYGSFQANIVHSKLVDSEIFSEIMGENGSILIDKISAMERIYFRDRKTGKTTDISETGISQKNLPLSLVNKFKMLYEDLSINNMIYEIDHFIELFTEGVYESNVNSFALSENVMKVLDKVRKQTNVLFPADKV